MMSQVETCIDAAWKGKTVKSDGIFSRRCNSSESRLSVVSVCHSEQVQLVAETEEEETFGVISLYVKHAEV